MALGKKLKIIFLTRINPRHFISDISKMTNSNVDELINLVQRLRQEKAACEETISQTKHKARVLERRVEEVSRQVGLATAVKEEKEAMMAALKGRVESKRKMFEQVKQKENLTQATGLYGEGSRRN